MTAYVYQCLLNLVINHFDNLIPTINNLYLYLCKCSQLIQTKLFEISDSHIGSETVDTTPIYCFTKSFNIHIIINNDFTMIVDIL